MKKAGVCERAADEAGTVWVPRRTVGPWTWLHAGKPPRDQKRCVGWDCSAGACRKQLPNGRPVRWARSLGLVRQCYDGVGLVAYRGRDRHAYPRRVLDEGGAAPVLHEAAGRDPARQLRKRQRLVGPVQDVKVYRR